MKEIRVGIIEDSASCMKNNKDLLLQLNNELEKKGFKFIYEAYTNPVDYKIRNKEFDIVIIDYHFSSYTYGANGFYMAKYTKEKYPKCLTIINSSYSPFEIGHLLDEFKIYVDEYAHKKETKMSAEHSLKSTVLRCVRKLVDIPL